MWSFSEDDVQDQVEDKSKYNKEKKKSNKHVSMIF
jgi:hypothetical protein